MDNNNLYERYQRQIILSQFGEIGQQKLLSAKVLVIGAGGLGCPVLQYLAAAGVGTIGIVDGDVVSLNNLHRQVLYTTKDVGASKALKAAEVLEALNPEINIIPIDKRLEVNNALELIDAYDIIIDGTDNFSTRYMINDACVLLNKPLVYGAISQFEGQVAIFNFIKNNGVLAANYRDLFPEPPKDDEIQNCAEAGVLGVLPGIIGTMMANETIKLITGIGKPLINKLFTYNSLNNETYQLNLMAQKETRSLIPTDNAAFLKMDYHWLCAAHSPFEIDLPFFNQLINNQNIAIIDVREMGELPIITGFYHTKFPLSQLKERLPTINNNTVVLVCQSGKRSLQAAQILNDNYGSTKKIYSLKGGIINWKIS